MCAPTHLDLLLALLHRHLQLELAILQPKHLISLRIQLLAQTLHLELEHVVRHHRIFLRLGQLPQVPLPAVILHLELGDRSRQSRRFLLALLGLSARLLQIVV